MADEINPLSTTTVNYGWVKPTVGGDGDQWGGEINTDLDGIDSVVHGIQTSVPAASSTAPVMDGTATAGSGTTWARGDHVHPIDTSRYAASNPSGYVTSVQAASAAPVQSVATKTGVVTLVHGDITDWATSVPQPATIPPLMDSAATVGTGTTFARVDHIHPSDTTKLSDAPSDTNTYGRKGGAWSAITAGGASVTVSDTAPATPKNGDLWYDSVGGQLYVWYTDPNTSQWVIAVNTGGSASITVSDTPPANPITGTLWYDSVEQQAYVWYNDGTSSQWVPTSNPTPGPAGPAGPAGSLLMSVTHVTAAQFATLNTAPTVLIPAVAGQIIVPSWISCNFTYGTAAYTMYPGIYYQNDTGNWDLSGGSTGPVQGIEGATANFFALGAATSGGAVLRVSPVNTALILRSSANPTAGNGTATVTVGYALISP